MAKKQMYIDGLNPPRIPKLDELIDEYGQISVMKARQLSIKLEIRALMIENNIITYVHNKYGVDLEQERKPKFRKVKQVEEEEEEEENEDDMEDEQ